MILYKVSADIDERNTSKLPITPTEKIEENLALGGKVYNSMPLFVSKDESSAKGCILTEGTATGGTGNVSLEFVTISLQIEKEKYRKPEIKRVCESL